MYLVIYIPSLSKIYVWPSSQETISNSSVHHRKSRILDVFKIICLNSLIFEDIAHEESVHFYIINWFKCLQNWFVNKWQKIDGF